MQISGESPAARYWNVRGGNLNGEDDAMKLDEYLEKYGDKWIRDAANLDGEWADFCNPKLVDRCCIKCGSLGVAESINFDRLYMCVPCDTVSVRAGEPPEVVAGKLDEVSIIVPGIDAAVRAIQAMTR